MSVVQKEPTKDGRRWVFRDRYTTLQGETKEYTSPKFKTKREALEEEQRFLLHRGRLKTYDMTFKDLFNIYFDNQKIKVKSNTLRSYKERFKYLKSLEGIIVSDFNSTHYDLWRSEMMQYELSDATRNNVQKLLKALLNYASKKYKYNFREVYSNIEYFKDPDELVTHEMDFYTYEEFMKFINVEDDLLYKVAFEILFYCGLRVGELLALTWKHIDFNRKELKVNSNVVKNYLGDTRYLVTTPKTKSSTRTIPISKLLLGHLQELKKLQQQVYGFKEKWFILGTFDPISWDKLRLRKKRNCELADVKEIRLHDFRHSCASLLISKGANITLVAKYLGHSKIDLCLNVYGHLYKSDLDDLVSQIDELNIE